MFSKSVKDKRRRAEDKEILEALEVDFNKEKTALKSQLVSKLFTLLSGKTSQGLVTRLGEDIIPKELNLH